MRHIALTIFAATILGVTPAAAGNFEFVVAAERGLDLRVIGYGRGGDTIFDEIAPVPETRDGAPTYVVRIDETILQANGLSAWCVEDRSSKWDVPSGDGVMVCDDRPSETRGSYRFTARAERPTVESDVAGPPPIETVTPERSAGLLAACIQTELNGKGYDAGAPDGVLGAKTVRAAEAYLKATPDSALGPINENLGAWCDQLARPDAKPMAIEVNGDIGPLAGNAEKLVQGAYGSVVNLFRRAPIETITFYVSSDEAWLADKYLRANGLPEGARKGKMESFGACDPIAEFGYRSVYICAEHTAWERGAAFQLTVFAHEFFHALSGDLARTLGERACCYDLSKMGPLGPEWLKEGGAQYAAIAAVATLAKAEVARQIEPVVRELKGVDLDLATRNTREGYNKLGRDKSELVGIVASHILTERAGKQSLPNYYRYLGYGVGHEEAFTAAFGTTIAELQVMLDAYVDR